MSKLDDILTQATATAYCAGRDWSKANPTTQYVDKASDEAKEAIKALMLELVGEDKEIPRPTDDESRDRFYRVSGQNFTRNEIRKRIQAL